MAHKKRVYEKTIDAIPPKHACGLCGYRTNSKFSLSRHKEKCNRSLNQNPKEDFNKAPQIAQQKYV